MTRQVALANDTYARLRRSRRPGESFSLAIERLLDAVPRDPLAFPDLLPAPPMDAQTWTERVQRARRKGLEAS